MNWFHREPTLNEILSDSIVRAVMEADGVDPQEQVNLLHCKALHRLRHQAISEGIGKRRSLVSTSCRSRKYGPQHDPRVLGQGASGPLAFFQASTPPPMWQAAVRPASCAACTAMAERSPKAQ
jgi:hypothetical protein